MIYGCQVKHNLQGQSSLPDPLLATIPLHKNETNPQIIPHPYDTNVEIQHQSSLRSFLQVKIASQLPDNANREK